MLELVLVAIGLAIAIAKTIVTVKKKIRMKKEGPNLDDMIILEGNVFYFYHTGTPKKVETVKMLGPAKKAKRVRKKKGSNTVKRRRVKKKLTKIEDTRVKTSDSNEKDTKGDTAENEKPVFEEIPDDEYDHGEGSSVIAQKNQNKAHIIMDPIFDHAILGKNLFQFRD